LGEFGGDFGQPWHHAAFGQEERRLGVVEGVGEEFAGEGVVDGAEHGASFPDAEHGEGGDEGVLHQEGHALSTGDAEAGEVSGDTVREGGDFGKGQGPVIFAVVEIDGIGRGLGPGIEAFDDDFFAFKLGEQIAHGSFIQQQKRSLPKKWFSRLVLVRLVLVMNSQEEAAAKVAGSSEQERSSDVLYKV
jgi:hypothetical protein